MNTNRRMMLVSGSCNVENYNIGIKNDINVGFKQVIPVITLQGFTISGIGPQFCWWSDGIVSVLVSRRLSNGMLHGHFPEGIIITFPDKKREGNEIMKFIPINGIDPPNFK